MKNLFKNKSVKNIRGYINPYGRNVNSILFYEKHLKKGSIAVVEHYTNHKLDTYFETDKTEHFTITRGFSCDGVLFTTEVLYLNQEGEPYMYYHEVLTNEGVLQKHYRKINTLGQYSLEGYDSFSECLRYKPHII